MGSWYISLPLLLFLFFLIIFVLEFVGDFVVSGGPNLLLSYGRQDIFVFIHMFFAFFFFCYFRGYFCVIFDS